MKLLRSLRAQSTALQLLFVLAVEVVYGLAALYALRDSAARVAAQRIEEARELAHRFDAVLELAQERLAAVAAQPGLGPWLESRERIAGHAPRGVAADRRHSGPEPLARPAGAAIPQRETLHYLFFKSPLLSNVLLVDRAGTLLWTEPYDEDRIGAGIRLDYPALQRAFAERRLQVSHDELPWRPDPAAVLVQPVLDLSGGAAGALVGIVDLDALRLTGFLGGSAGGTSVLVDQQGRRISSTASPEAFPEEGLRGESSAGATGRWIEAGGARWLVVRAPLARAPWSIVSAVPERKVTASLRRLQLTLVLSGIALGGAALAFSLLTASRLVRPIEVLTYAAHGVPRGDFDRPVPRNAPGELGDLANAFVGMRGDLQATLRGLRESEEKYRQSIDTASDPIYAVDPQSGAVLHANRRAEDLAGVAHRALEGRAFADLLVNEERQLALDYVAQLASGAGSRRLAEANLLHGARGLSPVSISGTRIVHGGGSFVLLICSDLMERKRMESELVQAEKMSTVGILAAGILHELNTPLSYVLANLEDASPRLARLAPHNDEIRVVHEAVQEAVQGAHRAAEIGRDLRGFARTATAHDGAFDLREAVRLALRLARHELRNRARVVTEFGDVPPVVGHPTEISQVFLNLLVNAAHAIPAGRPEEHQVRIITHAREGVGVARVEDSGCGIGPDHLARIFEPFFTTKPDGVGTGLGLSISRDIVRRAGGEIHVESRVGVGTTFIVELPLAA